MPTITDPRQREELLRICDPIDGPLYWFEHYYRTFDKPKRRVAKWPGWPYLQRYVMELHNPSLPKGEQQNILVEKSRDMLITLTTAGYMLYAVQFIPNWSGFVTSRRENEVDDGGDMSTTDSIFGMIRFGWLQQPIWMQVPLLFSHLKIRNVEPGMNSYITGESANPHAGRGKSVTFKYGDEFAFVPQSEKVHASMSGGNYRTLIYCSTANFTGNAFYRLRHDERGGFRVLTFHYSLRPGRDAAWAAKMKKKMSRLEWETEYEIQYEFTSDRSIFPRFDPRVHVKPVDELPTTGEPYITFDDGHATPGAMYFCFRKDGALYVVDEVYEAGIQVRVSDDLREQGVRDWVTIAKGLARKYGFEPADVTVTLGPESSAAGGHSNTGALFMLEGFKVHVAGKNKLGRIRTVDRLMIATEDHKSRLYIGDNCFNMLMEIPRYEWQVKNGQITEKPHGINDHACDALGVIAEFLFPDIQRDEPESDWAMDPTSWDTEGVIGEELR